MDIKTLLGDELFGKVTEALKGKGTDGKDVTLLVNDGSYIPKTKFDEVNEQKNTYKTQVDTLNGQMKDLEKAAKGNDELLKQIDTMKSEKEGLEGKIKDISLTSAVKLGLINSKAKYADLLISKVDKSKLEIAADGSVKGLDDQIKSLQEGYKDLFEAPPAGGGANPPGGGGGGTKNPWAKESFNLTEQGKLLKENPTLAAQLKVAAK